MKTIDVYHPWKLELVHGSGTRLTDNKGKHYLDFYGGHGVISIGHNHPEWVSALTKRFGSISYYSNAITISEQETVAEQFNRVSGLGDYRLFLCNSGTEANENALKIASFQTGRSKVLAFKGAFHGRTVGAIAVTDNPAIQAPFGRELLQDFFALDDAEGVRKALQTGQYAAVIVEGIQGVAGVFEPTAEVWKVIDEVSKQTGSLFIADEIQSGCGRTGNYFAFQHWGVTPDLVTMAKGIGNGFPVAGVLVHPDIRLAKGQLGTTFGGSYLACAALGAVLTELESGELMQHAVALSNELKLQLLSLEGVKAVRGRGLMLGIELKAKAVEVQELLLEYGIICGTSSCKHTLRILPPLTITRDEMLRFAETFRTVMDLIAVPEKLAES